MPLILSVPIVVSACKFPVATGQGGITQGIHVVIPGDRKGMDFILIELQIFGRRDGIKQRHLGAAVAGGVAHAGDDVSGAF